jgi:hypothetical protein
MRLLQCMSPVLARMDIARSQMDVRFRGKNGRAADITGTTEFGPAPDMSGPLLLQCTGLTCYT